VKPLPNGGLGFVLRDDGSYEIAELVENEEGDWVLCARQQRILDRRLRKELQTVKRTLRKKPRYDGAAGKAVQEIRAKRRVPR